METSDGITLEYHPANSSRTAYWLGIVGGKEMRFVRVLVGVALPELDRQQAAIVALGELDRSFAPSDFTGLGAAVGTWQTSSNLSSKSAAISSPLISWSGPKIIKSKFGL